MGFVERTDAGGRLGGVPLFARKSFELDAQDSAELMLSPAQFERELNRQRAHADRTNAGFVFLSLDLEHKSRSMRNRRVTTEALTKVVQRRTRLSDHVGWDGSDARRVGIILRGAEETGLLKFIDDVEDEFRSSLARSKHLAMPEILCSVYVYPNPAATGEGPALTSSAVRIPSAIREVVKT